MKNIAENCRKTNVAYEKFCIYTRIKLTFEPIEEISEDYIFEKTENDCISYKPGNIDAMMTISERSSMNGMTFCKEKISNFSADQDEGTVADALKSTNDIIGCQLQTDIKRLLGTIKTEIELSKLRLWN